MKQVIFVDSSIEDVLEYKKSQSEKIAKLEQERKEAIDELRHNLKSCPHPEEYIEEKSKYYEGSYLNVATTVYWRQCSICGEESEGVTESHSWYG